MSDPIRDQLRKSLAEQIAPAFRPEVPLARQRQLLAFVRARLGIG